jgi:hypothetical protein
MFRVKITKTNVGDIPLQLEALKVIQGIKVRLVIVVLPMELSAMRSCAIWVGDYIYLKEINTSHLQPS